jgi:biopolymer transport protein ExbD
VGAKVGGKKGGAIADLNVTPLVDVVLVLLIIFMVVTPMLSSGVDVRLPKARTSSEEKDMGQHLVISVKGDGTMFVDRDEVTLDTVVGRVEEVRANRSLLVKGDQAATWRQVRGVMDKLNQANIGGTETMLLATEKIKE